MAHLITTALDATLYDANNDVIYLGKWCKDNELQCERVAEPYGLSHKAKVRDIDYLQKFELILLKEITKTFNEYHHLNYDTRIWSIIVGHWLKRFVYATYNRFKAIEQCMALNEDIESITQLIEIMEPPLDGATGVEQINDDIWNNFIYAQAALFLNPKIKIDKKFVTVNKSINSNVNKTIGNSIKCIITKYYNLIFIRSPKVYIYNSKFSIINCIKSVFIINEFIPITNFQSISVEKKVDSILRKSLSDLIVKKYNNLAEKFISNFLYQFIPTAYFENFNEYRYLSRTIHPKNKPELIFTSNSFDEDELFKIWTAQNVFHGAKYIIGQHGCNYKTNYYRRNTVEELVSDKFITWGWWCEKEDKYERDGLFIKSSFTQKKNGENFIIFLKTLHSLEGPWDSYFEYSIYIESLLNFIRSFKEKNKLIIRMHPSRDQYYPGIVDKIKSIDKNLRVDFDGKKANKIIHNSRILIITYDSTLILQSIFNDIKFVAFLGDNLDYVSSQCLADYQLMIEAGIFHLSFESIEVFLSKTKDIEQWWNLSTTQEALNTFSNKYCYKKSSVLLLLSKYIGNKNED